MGKITGFLEFERNDRDYEAVEARIRHWREFVLPLPDGEVRDQAARCMNCGIPYCHTGCPVNNQIPDWNDLVYTGAWREAARNLHSTNNFPEFTGRVCPAPCEASCTLNIDDNPVTIKTIECAIVDRAFSEGWVKPEPPAVKTGKSVAVVGSGPAGLACAQQLARAGHHVHVYEKWPKPGGLLRYGIPDFKMEKHLVSRRVSQMEAEGVSFHCGIHIGVDQSVEDLIARHDAVVLAGGAEKGRDLPIHGRGLDGVHFAMEFLPQQNRRVSGEPQDGAAPILATGKHVVVIGGGDTGSDCIGTSIRQGALVGHQFRDHAAASREGEQGADLARLAAQAAHLVEPRRRRGAGFRRAHPGVRRRERRREEAALRALRQPLQADRGHRVRICRPTSCCSPWASCIRCTKA